MILQLNACLHISETLPPVFPKPITPTVLFRRFDPKNSVLSPFQPFRSAISDSFIFLSKFKIIATACSATASEFPPVWLTTKIPFSVHASTSIVS